jgi:hypothetical protein
MTTLKISIDIPNLNRIDVPVTMELLNEKLERLRTMVVSGETSLEDVSPGIYVVQAVLPSGEISAVPVQIKEDDVEVDASLRASASPQEWLAPHQFFGGFHRPSRGSKSVPEKLKIRNKSQKAWLRIWSFEGGESSRSGRFSYQLPSRWELEDISGWSQYQHLSDNTPNLTVIDLALPTGEEARYRVLQIGGEELPWRMIVLPPLAWTGPSSIQVLLRPSHSGARLNGGVAIKLVTQDLETESLSHSIDSGDYYHSGMMATRVLDDAERLLAEKISNPYGALVGGYYLLGRGDLERLHSWPNNFADKFGWLPDAAIIHAWQILLDDNTQDKNMARERLLEAAERGLPIFKQGLRYLVEGLKSVSDTAHKRGEKNLKDSRVEDALKYLQNFTRAANWNQRFVTFYGSCPYKPSYKAVMGTLKERSISKRKQFMNFKLPIRISKS